MGMSTLSANSRQRQFSPTSTFQSPSTEPRHVPPKRQQGGARSTEARYVLGTRCIDAHIFLELSNKAKEWETKNGGSSSGGMSELGNKRKIRFPETGTPSRTRARSITIDTGSPTLRNGASTVSDLISRPKKDLKSRRRLS